MRWLWIFFLVSSPLPIQAQDARLSEIRDLLVPMRTKQEELLPARGASPSFTKVKHLLRDWIEPQLDVLRPQVWTKTLEANINANLKGLRLLCELDPGGVSDTPCPELGNPGYVGPIRLEQQNDFLIVITGLSIQNCGFDESAYAYEWIDEHWRRVWQSEQNEYMEDRYRPQTLEGVLISADIHGSGKGADEGLILTLGTNPWCTSNWQPFYYRLWRIGRKYPEPQLLLNEETIAFLGDDPPVRGRVEDNELQVEYETDGVGGIRRAIRRYIVDQNRVRRVEPVALTPRDFVDEWLQTPWTESKSWTSFAASNSWHRKLNIDKAANKYLTPDLPHPIMRCKTLGFWQESLRESEPKKEIEEQQRVFFLIRWIPPYHFTLTGISMKPWPRCDIADDDADKSWNLFPAENNR